MTGTVVYSYSPWQVSKKLNLCMKVEETLVCNCAQFNAWHWLHNEARP